MTALRTSGGAFGAPSTPDMDVVPARRDLMARFATLASRLFGLALIGLSLFLGMFMDVLSMQVLTIPVALPIV
ncbi:hypothetical protein LCGC14_3143620, partial [marine sediment metagenome]